MKKTIIILMSVIILLVVLPFVSAQSIVSVQLKLQNESNETIADATVFSANPNLNFGTELDISTGNDSQVRRTYIMWNISMIPSNAENIIAMLTLFSTVTSPANPTISVHLVNGTWGELNITYNNQPCGSGLGFGDADKCNLTAEDSQTDLVQDTFIQWNVTAGVKRAMSEGFGNVSFVIRLSDNQGVNDENGYRSKEYTADTTQRPFLNITFDFLNDPPSTPTIIFPTPALFTNIVPVDINVTFPADLNGDAITITYHVNGQLNQTSAGNISISPDDGTITLDVSLSDGIDSSPNATVTFTVDTSEAILTIISPTAKAFDSDIPVDILCTDINLVSLEYILVNSSGIQDFVINSTPIGNELTIKTSITVATLGLGTYDFNSTCSTATSSNVTSSVTLQIGIIEEETSQLLNNLLTVALTIGFTIFALVIAKREIFSRRSKK